MRSFLAALPLCLLISTAAIAETCIASVYGVHDKDQTGTETASGIPLRDGGATMAHRTRPLRSYADVTNLRNGKMIPLLVTDRGPFIAGRCVDLSHAAAILLGCRGLCPVKVQSGKAFPCRWNAPTPSAPSAGCISSATAILWFGNAARPSNNSNGSS